MIFLSDPYSVDGAVSHSNDWLVLLPVFKDGRLIGYTSMFGHQSDIGGKVVGPAFTAAEARWASQERRLYGSGGIRLTREDAVITGDRIESDDKLAKVKVTGNARAVKGGTPQ